MRMYDEIIRAKLSGIESGYSPDIWNSIERKLDNKKPKARPLFAFITIGSLALISAVCISFICYSANKDMPYTAYADGAQQEDCKNNLAMVEDDKVIASEELFNALPNKADIAAASINVVNKKEVYLDIAYLTANAPLLIEDEESPLTSPIILSYIDEAEDIWIREKRIISSAEDFERMDRIIYAPISKISNIDVELKSSYRTLNLDDSK